MTWQNCHGFSLVQSHLIMMWVLFELSKGCDSILRFRSLKCVSSIQWSSCHSLNRFKSENKDNNRDNNRDNEMTMPLVLALSWWQFICEAGNQIERGKEDEKRGKINAQDDINPK